jgi:peroxiredoxin
MKRAILLMTALFALVITTNAQGLAVGSAMESFSLPDLNGNMQTLGKLKGRNGTVVIFLSAQCPVMKGYKDRINQAAAEAQTKGINFIGINSNSTESLGWVKSNAAQFGYRFPILIDKGNALADKLDARATPEVYFIDGENVLVYRGAIDNDRAGTRVTEKYLLTAFDASLASRPISRNSVPAFGCAIKRAAM